MTCPYINVISGQDARNFQITRVLSSSPFSGLVSSRSRVGFSPRRHFASLPLRVFALNPHSLALLENLFYNHLVMTLSPNPPALALGWAFNSFTAQPLENPTASQITGINPQTSVFAPNRRKFGRKIVFTRFKKGHRGSIALCYFSVISGFLSRSRIKPSLTVLCYSLLNRALILLHHPSKVKYSIGKHDGC